MLGSRPLAIKHLEKSEPKSSFSGVLLTMAGSISHHSQQTSERWTVEAPQQVSIQGSDVFTPGMAK
jgi:hypothetical protein